ncbi:hypothetical protein [Umezawaea sp. Da 62-37]|nr:hypothetical protein [Umezawaea sp. Da 62-37]WNV86900.1 hypothetical protein RM788_01015 [Umezawaea sp. Da 62-37]
MAARSGVHATDTAADHYFPAWSAPSAHPADDHYLARNAHLLELIADSRA